MNFNKNMKYTFIYTLSDPETGVVRYIGKTNNIKQRLSAHNTKSRFDNTHRSNWLKSLRDRNLKPILEILDEVEINNWQYWENYWISQFRAWGFDLVNHTEGGEGCTFSNKTSFKRGNKPWNEGRGNSFICGVCNLKFKSSISSNRKFCSRTCNAIYQSNNSNNGTFKKGIITWNNNKTGYKTSKRKPVIQMDYEGNFIKEWDSSITAAEYLGCTSINIQNACNGRSKSAKNFKWKYKDE